MSKLTVLRVCATPLAISKGVTLLQNPPEGGVSALPPVTPKAGEIYIYRSKVAKENGLCSNYQLRQPTQGVCSKHCLPRQHCQHLWQLACIVIRLKISAKTKPCYALKRSALNFGSLMRSGSVGVLIVHCLPL